MKPMLKSLMLVAVLLAAAVTASAADVSGTWNVDGSVAGHPVQFTCTLRQDGGNLTGTARIHDADRPVTGTVQDKTVTFKFDTESGGSTVLTGTLSSDKDMSGTIAVAIGAGGEFTAKKQEHGGTLAAASTARRASARPPDRPRNGTTTMKRATATFREASR